jgi:hypothetical protein
MPLLRLFWDICQFRKGPQDVPASQALLQLNIAAYSVVSVLQALLDNDWLQGLLQVPLAAAILLAFVWVSLTAAGKPNRLLQTLIAMFATDALISSLALPVQVLLKINPDASLAHLAMLLLMLWHMGVIGHIFRHALSRSLTIGLALSFVYIVFTVQVMVMLFGGGPTPDG